MSLHVLHLTSGHDAFDTRIVTKQCGGLAAAGYRVTLVARRPENSNLPLPEGVRLVTVPRPRSRRDRFMNTCRHVVRAAVAEAPDIYHFHDPDLLPRMIRLAASGARVIYDVHEDYRTSAFDRKWLPKLLRGAVSSILAKLEHEMGQRGWIAAATPEIAAYFDPERTELIQNFPTMAEFSVDSSSPPYEKREKRLVYVGAITAERGVEEIVAALPSIARQHPDVAFDLIGPAHPDFLSHIKTLPGWAMTVYHGRQDRRDVIRLLNHARIGLVTLRDVPRYRVAQPTKLYEYMAAGLPIVASDFPRWRMQVGDDVGLFVMPHPDSISAAVCRLLDNPQKTIVMGQAGRKIVQNRFSWEADLPRLIALYEKAMNA